MLNSDPYHLGLGCSLGANSEKENSEKGKHPSQLLCRQCPMWHCLFLFILLSSNVVESTWGKVLVGGAYKTQNPKTENEGKVLTSYNTYHSDKNTNICIQMANGVFGGTIGPSTKRDEQWYWRVARFQSMLWRTYKGVLGPIVHSKHPFESLFTMLKVL